MTSLLRHQHGPYFTRFLPKVHFQKSILLRENHLGFSENHLESVSSFFSCTCKMQWKLGIISRVIIENHKIGEAYFSAYDAS